MLFCCTSHKVLAFTDLAPFISGRVLQRRKSVDFAVVWKIIREAVRAILVLYNMFLASCPECFRILDYNWWAFIYSTGASSSKCSVAVILQSKLHQIVCIRIQHRLWPAILYKHVGGFVNVRFFGTLELWVQPVRHPLPHDKLIPIYFV